MIGGEVSIASDLDADGADEDDVDPYGAEEVGCDGVFFEEGCGGVVAQDEAAGDGVVRSVAWARRIVD